ncbi:pentatricopeptide repeat-containing protein At2g17670-like [Vigna umbellata]|uniref:pentatricopeptide repeat-containing protein At2g17670-like n=1 Tax=Vigna umbellata TaxID=87088 RepID=UPI001F5EF1F1|nr:pentatricopeptide repeat-containing protein At2g17670-like [Vigna umbellata]
MSGRNGVNTQLFAIPSTIRNPSSLLRPQPPSPPSKPFPPTKKKSPKPIPQQPNPLFKSPNLEDAKKIFDSIANSSKDPRFPNSLLHSYAKIATSTSDSVKFLHHITKTLPSFSPDHSTFHILLSHSCTNPDSNSNPNSNSALSAIHQTLNSMRAAGVTPDAATTDVSVRALCSAGHLDHAVDLIKEFASKHCPPDTYTFNFLVKHLCKARALSTVYAFIDEMREKFGVKPDLVSYTILIDNVCNGKNLREAMRLVSVLHEEGFKPDCFVYNTIMKGYCVLSRGSEAIEVYNKMKEEGVEPDLVTYNTLIFGLSKSGRVVEAKKLLRVMTEKGYLPDEVTYTTLMNGMCRKGEALAALALLGEMEGKGCSPNECTYNTLLHGLCKEGGLKLDTASYGTFVRALYS